MIEHKKKNDSNKSLREKPNRSRKSQQQQQQQKQRQSWIPSEVEIPVIIPSTRDEEDAGRNRDYNNHRATTTVVVTKPKPRPIVLVVVGVRLESEHSYWMEDCPAILREDFPDFPERINNTLELCRKCPHARIIHLHSVHPRRRWHSLRYYNARARNNNRNNNNNNNNNRNNNNNDSETTTTTGTTMAAESNKPIPEHRGRNNTNGNGGDGNGGDGNGGDGDGDGDGDPKELLIPDPSWSNAGQHQLREALRRIMDTNNNESPLVLVCGLVTSVCVRTASEVCCMEGCETLVLEETCADRGRDHHDAAIDAWGRQQRQPKPCAIPQRDLVALLSDSPRLFKQKPWLHRDAWRGSPRRDSLLSYLEV